MKLRWSSFRCAIAGICYLMASQAHARWHLLATLIVITLGIVLNVTHNEWLALVLAMALVWISEAINTAIEQACDAITKDDNPHIAHAKDVAAGAVLLAAIFATIIGLIIFVPKLLNLIP